MNTPEQGTTILNHDAAGRLLGMASPEVGGPLGEVIRRLERADGAAWLNACLKEQPLAPIAGPDGKPDARTSLDVLKRLKHDSKRLLPAAGDEGTRLRAVLAYFVAVGAALAQHGVLISSRPQSDVEQAILDLAAALPAEWAVLLEPAIKPPA